MKHFLSICFIVTLYFECKIAFTNVDACELIVKLSLQIKIRFVGTWLCYDLNALPKNLKETLSYQIEQALSI